MAGWSSFGEPRQVLHSYHFVCPPHQLASSRIQRFLGWLKDEAANDREFSAGPVTASVGVREQQAAFGRPDDRHHLARVG